MSAKNASMVQLHNLVPTESKSRGSHIRLILAPNRKEKSLKRIINAVGDQVDGPDI